MSASEDQGQGLTSTRVLELRQQFGFNELPEKRPNLILSALSYFWGPIPWMIEVAAGLSLATQNWDDLAIILTLLVVNGFVGFWEERQAGNAVAALKARLAVQARVLRDGTWTLSPARELVPGDRVRVRPGDIVPADIVLSGPGELDVDQSVLTGESLPQGRQRGETVYSSSTVVRGESFGTVVATARKTFFGRTAELVETTHTVSHFQRAVLQIGNFLIVVALALAILIEAVSLVRGSSPLDSLQFVLVLTIAAIPVALPTVLSVTMAVGAGRMAREQAVVSRLPAMEELAGMEVLCSDKTGTLTQNRMSMGEPYAAEGVDAESVVRAAALASRVENQDPIDLAILIMVPPDELAQTTVLNYDPFDPTTKRTEARIREAEGSVYSVSKGACQVIFELTGLSGAERERADTAVTTFADRGYRTLAVARTDEAGRWRFLGILPLFDPLRPDAREVVAATRALGVNVKILTGDQLAIGRETARRLGLGTNFLSAEDLRAASTPGEPNPSLETVDGFAQVFPQDKFAIVDRLEREGHIVGMTGDGVNDAPALKKADVGVAVSGATDVARSAASVVLLAPGLNVLVDAIRESRRIFARMTAYAIYRVGETIRLLLFLSLSILLFALYPVTAVMIVLIALLNDGAILSIAYDRAEVAATPTRWEMRTVLTIATVLGVVGVAFSFLLLVLAVTVWALPFAVIQTMIYLKLSVAGHFGIFATRTKGPFWKSRPATILLVAVLGTQAVATLIAVTGFLFTPLPLIWVGVVWGFAVLDLVTFDLAKQATYRSLGRSALEKGDQSTRHPRGPSKVRALFYRRRFATPARPATPASRSPMPPSAVSPE